MKLLLTILAFNFCFNLSAQHRPSKPTPFLRDWLKQNDDVAHFYGSCLVNDVAYTAQGLLFPEWKPTKKLLISNAITISVISLKETYDCYKPNKTGWSWDDFFIGVWAMAIYTIVRICLNDYRTHRKVTNRQVR